MTAQTMQQDDTQTSTTSTTTSQVQITDTDRLEIEQSFAQAKDFRAIGEKITAPFDNIVAQSAKVIDSDPIMNVSDELTKMNGEVQAVYGEIINND